MQWDLMKLSKFIILLLIAQIEKLNSRKSSTARVLEILEPNGNKITTLLFTLLFLVILLKMVKEN